MIARAPVTGFTPALASVAAITPRSLHVIEIEHCMKYASTLGIGSDSMILKFFSRYAIVRLRSPLWLSD
jgi:hypothetical protein